MSEPGLCCLWCKRELSHIVQRWQSVGSPRGRCVVQTKLKHEVVAVRSLPSRVRLRRIWDSTVMDDRCATRTWTEAGVRENSILLVFIAFSRGHFRSLRRSLCVPKDRRRASIAYTRDQQKQRGTPPQKHVFWQCAQGYTQYYSPCLISLMWGRRPSRNQ